MPAERQGTILEMICTRGEADDLAVVFKLLGKPDGLTPAVRRKVVELLTDAAVTRKVKPSGDLSPLVDADRGRSRGQRRGAAGAAIRLAAAWKLQRSRRHAPRSGDERQSRSSRCSRRRSTASWRSAAPRAGRRSSRSPGGKSVALRVLPRLLAWLESTRRPRRNAAAEVLTRSRVAGRHRPDARCAPRPQGGRRQAGCSTALTSRPPPTPRSSRCGTCIPSAAAIRRCRTC